MTAALLTVTSLNQQKGVRAAFFIRSVFRGIQNTGIRGGYGPVIQATGRSESEDDLGSGDFVSGY
jgi:hypothetical protein